MNHIEYYESIINNLDLSFELRHWTKEIYKTPMKEALEILLVLNKLFEMKENDFMKSGN